MKLSDVRCQMSDVRCQMSDVRCQMSDVRCQMSCQNTTTPEGGLNKSTEQQLCQAAPTVQAILFACPCDNWPARIIYIDSCDLLFSPHGLLVLRIQHHVAVSLQQAIMLILKELQLRRRSSQFIPDKNKATSIITKRYSKCVWLQCTLKKNYHLKGKYNFDNQQIIKRTN